MGRFKHQEEDRWISVSDIMTGLMVIFLFIAIAYIIEAQKRHKVIERAALELELPVDSIYDIILNLEQVSTTLSKKQDTISMILADYRNKKRDIYLAFEREFAADFSRWGAEMDSTTLTIRFNGEQTKFAPSSDVVPSGMKRILNEFLPRYFAIVTDPAFFEEILEVKIEGHAYKSGQGYTTILTGSQNRARNVLLYVRNTSAFKKLPSEVKKAMEFKLTTTGMGYNRMIDERGNFVQISGGSPCANCSRRVEFTILTATERVLQQLERQL